ncbi:MAG: hypothetical protein WD771_05990 [Gemmatimonadaceae bacterium]
MTRALVVALALTPIACKQVEVFPTRVQIAVNNASATTATFDARARYRKNKGGDLIDEPITWHTSAPGVAITTGANGRDARITMPTASSGRVTVEVRAGGRTDQLVVDLVVPSGDRATAQDHVIPSVLLTIGGDGVCPSDHTVSFVRGGSLAARGQACVPTDLVALTGYAAPARGQPWTDAADDQPFPTAAVWRPAKLRIWLLRHEEMFAAAGLSAGEVATILANRATQMDDAIGVANGILFAARAGLVVQRIAPPKVLLSSAINCSTLFDEIALDGDIAGTGSTPDLWDPNAINVYVMDAFTEARGQYCWPPEGSDAPHNVIRIQPNALPSTLAHELGHLAGLVVPWGENGRHTGHVDAIKGFAKDNLMWGRVNLETTAARTRLSLGQVYRMHFDPRSFFAAAAAPQLDCGCDPYAGACGLLSRDVRPIANAGGRLGASAAFCEAPGW